MKYAQFNTSGELIARYDDEINSTLPDDAVAIDDELFFKTITEMDGRWTYIDGVISKQPFPPRELNDIKRIKSMEINAARAAANTGTFTHGGKTFSCDALSRGDIDGMNGYVAIFAALPAVFTGEWKAADNTFLPIPDVAAWKAFYSAMVIQGAANFAHAQDLKAQLEAAATPEDVAAIVW